MVGTFLTYHHRQPEITSVDGIYDSAACGRLILRNGRAEYERNTVSFTLVFDKFGLMAEMNRPLGPFYVQNMDGTREPIWFHFNGHTVAAVTHAHQDCIFSKVA